MLTATPARSNPVYTTSVGIKPQPDGLGCRVANDHYASPKAVQLETKEKKWSGHRGGMLAWKNTR